MARFRNPFEVDCPTLALSALMALLGTSGAATLTESKNGPGTTNFVSDSVGPLINSAPARERLQPKPPVLKVTWDRPYDTGDSDSGRADFILYSVDADSSLIPVLADNGYGALVPCPATRCGQPFGPGSGPGAPSFTLVTDRPVKLTVTLFTNLGGYVNSLSGEITPAHLEMDTKGSLIGASQFRKDEQGRYAMRMAWNPRAHDGRIAGSGAYLANVSASGLAKDAEGNTHSVAESRTFRFKVLDR